MILHERREKPIRLCVAMCSLFAGCEVHESLWNRDPQVTVTRGSAVATWPDAQVLMRIEDASTDAAVSDAAVSDAAVSDATIGDSAVNDATTDLDAGEDTPDAMLEEEDDSGQRCTFRVTTLPLGGRYTPRNIGAIWIERSDGTFIKTLERWAGVRLRYLTHFRAANPTGNKVDAVTSGTLAMFRAHSVGWNLSDVNGQEVPDGDYRVQVEVTDDDKTGQTLTLPFKKTSGPFESSAPDAEHFTGVRLRCR
jgi:hypothetical protein